MTGEAPVHDEGFDDFLDAVADGQGFYLACPNDHGSLPPRRACPACGDPDLTETPLPDRGEVVSFTVVHVATPDLAAETPYVTAIADFGPVRLTGILAGVDPEDAALGRAVAPGVATVAGKRRLHLRVVD